MLGITRGDKIRNEVTREGTNMLDTAIETIRRRLQCFGHVTRVGEERLLLRTLHCHNAGNRSSGRKTKRRIDNLKEDVGKQNLNLDEASHIPRRRPGVI